MSANIMPWFRMYTESVDDEKLRLLAFEDRWHFVALLCCKGQGILDDAGPLLRRKIAVKLGLDLRTLDDVARRLAEVGLLDRETLQPTAWDARQMRSDSSAERVRAYRERMKRGGNVTVTAQEKEAEKEAEKEEEKEREEEEKRKEAQKSADAPPPRTVKLDQAIPDGVKTQTWEDFLKIRKAKRAPVTVTAMAGLQREATKGCVDLNTAIEACVEYGWQSFNAGWYAERQTKPLSQSRNLTPTQARDARRDFTSAGLTNTGENNDCYDFPEFHPSRDDNTIDVATRFVV